MIFVCLAMSEFEEFFKKIKKKSEMTQGTRRPYSEAEVKVEDNVKIEVRS